MIEAGNLVLVLGEERIGYVQEVYVPESGGQGQCEVYFVNDTGEGRLEIEWCWYEMNEVRLARDRWLIEGFLSVVRNIQETVNMMADGSIHTEEK